MRNLLIQWKTVIMLRLMIAYVAMDINGADPDRNGRLAFAEDRDDDEACTRIEITSKSTGCVKSCVAWHAMAKKYPGLYVKQNRLENGMAVYKQGTDKYLWFTPQTLWKGWTNDNWIIGPSKHFGTHRGMIHVAGCGAAHFLPNSKCKGVWEYWNGFRWLPDNTVKITCAASATTTLQSVATNTETTKNNSTMQPTSLTPSTKSNEPNGTTIVSTKKNSTVHPITSMTTKSFSIRSTKPDVPGGWTLTEQSNTCKVFGSRIHILMFLHISYIFAY